MLSQCTAVANGPQVIDQRAAIGSGSPVDAPLDCIARAKNTIRRFFLMRRPIVGKRYREAVEPYSTPLDSHLHFQTSTPTDATALQPLRSTVSFTRYGVEQARARRTSVDQARHSETAEPLLCTQLGTGWDRPIDGAFPGCGCRLAETSLGFHGHSQIAIAPPSRAFPPDVAIHAPRLLAPSRVKTSATSRRQLATPPRRSPPSHGFQAPRQPRPHSSATA